MPEGRRTVETASAGDLKRTWTKLEADGRDWLDLTKGEGPECQRAATRVKNVWVSWGA